jgi:cytochrome c biogenesis protein
VVRFDGAVPFISVQVSHDPGQLWVLVFAAAMMGGLVVSLVVRRHRVWIRISPATTAGTVKLEVGGLARTDNSGWGNEFERLTERLLEGYQAPAAEPSRAMEPAGSAGRAGAGDDDAGGAGIEEWR